MISVLAIVPLLAVVPGWRLIFEWWRTLVCLSVNLYAAHYRARFRISTHPCSVLGLLGVQVCGVLLLVLADFSLDQLGRDSLLNWDRLGIDSRGCCLLFCLLNSTHPFKSVCIQMGMRLFLMGSNLAPLEVYAFLWLMLFSENTPCWFDLGRCSWPHFFATF